MSFFSFSRSSPKGHYPNYNHGYDYYRRPKKHSGILGAIYDALLSKKHRSYSDSDQYNNYHKRHKSWS